MTLEPVIRCDGHRTAVQVPSVELSESGWLTSAWIAPALFGTAGPDLLMGIMSAATTNRTGLSWTLGLDRAGHLVFQLIDGGSAERSPNTVRLRCDEPVPLLRWTHCAATVDQDGRAVRLYRDGNLVAHAELPPGWARPGDGTASMPVTVTVGRATDADAGPGSPFGYLAGLVAGASVSNDATSPTPGHGPDVDPVAAWLVDPERFAADRDRPQFHFSPPAHWMNEPHGILHYRGRHHLFYQRNELGPFWGNITWGHAVSTDLVHWTDVGSALKPWEIEYAPDGIWSDSSAYDESGRPILFFTAGDNRDRPNQRTAWASPLDHTDPELRDWTAGPAPVSTHADVVTGLAAQNLEPLPDEFRDPFVWQDGDHWFQLVGGGIKDRGGTAFLFRAATPTAGSWEFVGPLMIGDCNVRPDTGVNWELPILLPVGEDPVGRRKHALFVTPWWYTRTEHSLLYEWYWVGTWEPSEATWKPDHAEPRLLDYGGYFTGVTGSVDEQGRSLLWTIAQDGLSEARRTRLGWSGNTGLPLQISYRDGDLSIEPIEELACLRSGPVIDAHDVPSDVRTVDVGARYEILLEVELPVGGHIQVGLRCAESAPPAVEIVAERTDEDAGRVSVRRAPTHDPARDQRGGPFRLPPDEPVRLRIFADNSLVEAYVQRHRSVTTRAYARPDDSDAMRITCTPAGHIRRLVVWPLRPAPVQQHLVPSHEPAHLAPGSIETPGSIERTA